MQVKDVKKELSKQPAGTFLEFLKFNDSYIGACDITGVSPVWEMHPDTDGFFYIIEGQFEIDLFDGETPSKHIVNSGSSFVVPRGIWHKPGAPNGCKFIHFTPGQSLHSEVDDPRH